MIESIISQLSKPNQTLPTTRALHGFIAKTRLASDPFYATRILRFYAINSDLISARKVFDKTPERNIFLWNSIIRAHARARDFQTAFGLFRSLLGSETRPDNFTFACVARACSDGSNVRALRAVHGKVVSFGLSLDSICNSMLVSCYSKSGLVREAHFVFRRIKDPDLVLWNAMISCYGSCGDWMKGIEHINAMQGMGIRPDGYTMVGLINGLIDKSPINVREMVHAFCIKCGFESNDHVGSVLVRMYSKCKKMELACRVFDSLFEPDLVSWSTLIAGFSQSGDHLKALDIFRQFLNYGKGPDPVLLTSVLSASAHLAILGPGLEIHAYAVRRGYDAKVSVASALIDTYAKCGFLECGVKVFDKMPERNLVSYNAVISSLGLYGRARDAFWAFDMLLREGLKPDEATFAGLLCACTHSGLVDVGREYFMMMKNEYGLEAKTEHFVHMVKLLGMNGKLDEAYDLVRALTWPVDLGVWGALLSCCDFSKDYELVEVIKDHLSGNVENGSGYGVMVSNLFAGCGRWDDVARLRVDKGGAKGKMRGISRVDV
ncbi:pentatricopeptide repeat-containing protein [Striga asiatica]|uniref:Pentatricopeptide repeat-containing protein n=1 Tax=Striga asiatica TaxID=4170 RepID=A0A5A7Q020_STRAF|nr:pentatricopeptide repeat-containing protein [Striga asiatica]